MMERSGVFWLLLQVFCAVAVVNGTLNAKPYRGAKVFKILNAPQALHLIEQRGLDIWGSNGTFLDVMVPHNKIKAVSKELKQLNIPSDIKIDDLQAAILRQNPPVARAALREAFNFNNFQRLSTIHQYLDYLAKTYPQLVTVGIMGYTQEQRPLKYIKISSGKRNAKSVFIDGGIHAREWVSPASVTYAIKELVENRNALPKDLLDLDFYILPVLNPDGYEYTHTHDRMWRKNRSGSGKCLGADINRNFDFNFGGKGTSGDPCSETYRGRGPNSELEAQALTKFLLTLRGNLKAYITFHSYGQYILVPYGYDYNALAPDFNEMKRVGDEAARAIGNVAGEKYTVGNTANTLYPAAGGSDDWAKAKVGVKYAYCIELRDTGNNGFVLPAREIIPTAREAFEAIKVISSAAAKA